MKILRVYFKDTVINIGHKNHADHSVHNLERTDVGILIDNKVLVPYQNCKEILLDCHTLSEEVMPAIKIKSKKAT